MSDLMVREETAIAPQNPVAWAIANNVSPEQMLQYYQLDREMKADAARNAFNQAFASFKAEAVSVVKNVKVTAGPLVGQRYADLFGVVSAVIPALAKHGLSHSWRLSKDERDWIEVSCTIRHSQGHSEVVAMGAAPDTGPGRNAIQARGSAKSYLERYTLLAATGLAAQGEDDDANKAGSLPGGTMSEPDLVSWLDALENAPTEPELKKMFNSAFPEAQKAGDKSAMAALIKARDKRKAELQ